MSESRCAMLVRPSEVMAKDEDRPVKKEVDVCVKRELVECCVCASRALDCSELTQIRTASGTSLSRYLSRYTRADLSSPNDHTRLVCRTCVNLINVLEQAELEYLKLKETFEAIISKNPIFFPQTTEAILPVKLEYNIDTYDEPSNHNDSEDEPLAVTKKRRRRKVVKTSKKKVCVPTKRKTRTKKDSNNDATVEPVSVTEVNPVLRDVKKEDSIDGSETSQLNNGVDLLKVEMDFDDDDDDSNFLPDELSNGEEEMEPKKTRREKSVKKKPIHQCDQCDAKYTTFKRLELHKEKHSEGKPPFICEVCGAHYKHKRACDIHVALHKGISDWKCEECNKLFPSKGALQRHNNIHTGKLNYQCDLCGKSFIHTSSFKMHKLSHSGVKPHACDVCGLALMTRSHLKRHKRVHSGEKRHECNICGKRFSERYNLMAHAKSHEGVAEVTPPQPRRRLFRCPYCQERYERRYMLERHVSVSHGRTLERAPATPRNTMSKLLKAQAAARSGAGPAPGTGGAGQTAGNTNSPDHLTDTKEERSPDSRASSIVPAKQLELVSAVTATITAGSWSGAYAAEFGLRPDYPH